MTPSTTTSDGSSRPRALERLRRPSWGGSIGLFVVCAGWIVGLRPLGDNSFLTHLATGRLILDTGSVPSADPYTFSAVGEPWVVQSWLVSVAYGAAERLGGLDAVRVLTGVLAAVLAGLAWALLRPVDGLLARLATAAVFLGVGAGMWAERPFMVGLICLALLSLAIEGRLDPRWLLPMGWIWVNSHGSFPLGIGLLVVSALGRRLDRVPPTAELRCLRWVLPGMLLGAIGPVGPRLLVFPVELLAKQDLLSNVREWQAPDFTTTSERLFIIQLVAALLVVARRPSYRSALIVGVFGAAALLGSRNLAVASLVMLPVLATGLSGFGSMQASDRVRPARLGGALALVTLIVLTFARVDQEPLNLNRYPVAALAYLEDQQIDTREVRMNAPDYVGNFVEYVYGPERRVFYDDRFDMFPADVSEAQLDFNVAAPGMRVGLDRHDIDLVLVPSSSPTGQVLLADPSWRTLYQDDTWSVVCRRSAALAAGRRC